MKDWKNQYPLDTFHGETRRELEEFISGIIKDVCDEIIDNFCNLDCHLVDKINQIKEEL